MGQTHESAVPVRKRWNVFQVELLTPDLALPSFHLEADLLEISDRHPREGALGDQDVSGRNVPGHGPRATSRKSSHHNE